MATGSETEPLYTGMLLEDRSDMTQGHMTYHKLPTWISYLKVELCLLTRLCEISKTDLNS